MPARGRPRRQSKDLATSRLHEDDDDISQEDLEDVVPEM